MSGYFQTHYLELSLGSSFVVTRIVLVVAIVAILGEWHLDRGTIARRVVESVAALVLDLLLCELLNLFLSSYFASLLSLVLVVCGYVALRCRPVSTSQVVQCTTYLAFFVLILGISEAVGGLLDDRGISLAGVGGTNAVVIASVVAVVPFLRHFSTARFSFTPRSFAALVILVDVLGFVIQESFLFFLGDTTEAAESLRPLRLVICICALLLVLLTYYFFFALAKEYDEKAELLATKRRDEMDADMLAVARRTYEELREVRHEVKNHDAYMKSLLEAGDYDGLAAFFGKSLAHDDELVRYVQSGNQVVDATVNYKVTRAKGLGVEVETMLAVPPTLPYEDDDVCSLLSNLLDNAIEGAAASGAADKRVRLSMRPEKGYFVLRVSNPVDTKTVSPALRLTLETTKADKDVHGYGTKIIQRIVQKYDGVVSHSIKDERFVVDIMLASHVD